MKKIIIVFLAAISSLCLNAQTGIKITDLPLQSTNPTGAYLPVTIGGTTKKLNVNMVGVWDTYVRNDSLFKMRFGTETFISVMGDVSNVTTLSTTRNLTGVANVIEVLHGLTGTPESAIVKVSVASGDASEFSNFITKVDATRVYIIYSAAPINGAITFKITLTKPAS